MIGKKLRVLVKEEKAISYLRMEKIRMFLNIFRKEKEKVMYVIAGLGNPDKQYENTRHNIGFDAIDALAEKYNIDISIRKHRAYCGKGMINGNKVVLVKPQTYMNLSGESLRSVVDYYKIDPESELLVLFDDVSLDVGQLRIRKKGSAGGHNGIKNIIANLNTQNFARIKIGVGEKPKKMDLVDYVLGHFTKSERVLMDEAIEHAIQAAGMIVEGEMDSAMNIYNQKNKEISQQRKEEA